MVHRITENFIGFLGNHSSLRPAGSIRVLSVGAAVIVRPRHYKIAPISILGRQTPVLSTSRSARLVGATASSCSDQGRQGPRGRAWDRTGQRCIGPRHKSVEAFTTDRIEVCVQLRRFSHSSPSHARRAFRSRTRVASAFGYQGCTAASPPRHRCPDGLSGSSIYITQ
jgi:hypothetical protein